MPADDKTREDIQLDLLTMEYAKAAERYENIYRAVWQNFSYLGVIAAAILTFGSAKLETWVTILLAEALLLFWYTVQYLPLDKYAKDVLDRLAEIEAILNDHYFAIPNSEPRQFSTIKMKRKGADVDISVSLRHFGLHARIYPSVPKCRCEKILDSFAFILWSPKKEIAEVPYRINTAIRFFVIVSFMLTVCGFFLVTFHPWKDKIKIIKNTDSPKPIEIKVLDSGVIRIQTVSPIELLETKKSEPSGGEKKSPPSYDTSPKNNAPPIINGSNAY